MKRSAKTATCPICKTDQHTTRQATKCSTCQAWIYYQPDKSKQRHYYAEVEFSTTSGDKVTHWIQRYPVPNYDAAGNPLDPTLLDRTLFFVDLNKQEGEVELSEKSFDGFVSVDRFKNLLLLM